MRLFLAQVGADHPRAPGNRDAALISAAQKVEHYEMTGYGSVREYSKLLGRTKVASLLNETLEEKKAARKA